jgi:hypothetical protein
MTAHSAVPIETYRERALRKFKQQPLVPVGATSPIKHISKLLTDKAYRGRCHDGRTRNRDDEDAKGSVALVQQLVACAHHCTGTHRRCRRRGLVGIWLRQAYAGT